MEPLTLILIVFAVFVAFLMMTSGNRRKRLEKALKELETKRLRLLKSIEHVKLSFYQKKLDEKEAQDKIFEFEEKLRGLESQILDIKEKPLMRTLKKYEAGGKPMAEDKEVVEAQGAEAKELQKSLLEGIDEKAVVFFFILLIIGAMVIMSLMGGFSSEEPAAETIRLPLSAQGLPTTGTFPGGTAGLKVHIKNDQKRDLRGIVLTVIAPANSGVGFNVGDVDFRRLEVLEAGGSREIYFPIEVGNNAAEGEYVIGVNAASDEGVKSNTTAIIRVNVGGLEE